MADATPQNPVTTPEEPKLLAGKYKTADELEKAYKEAERSMHEAKQQRAELEKKVKELEDSKPSSPNDDLADYEYVSKKEMLEREKRLQDTLLQTFRKEKEELVGLLDAKMELTKIKQSHPDLPESEIRAVINEYPEDTNFDEALKKRREALAKVYGLHTTPPKGEKPMPAMPNQLQGIEQFGRENEDRSRIERMKKAGNEGSFKSVLKK